MGRQVHVVSLQQGYSDAVHQLAAADPGLSEAFSKGDRVVLKPNFVAPRKSSTGTTTSLELIRELADMLNDAGCKVYLCESPGMEYSWHQVFGYLGIHHLSKETGIEVVDYQNTKFVELSNDNNRFLRKIRVPAIVSRAKILNLPKLKTHVTTKVTLGMKNLMGLCHSDVKRWMHVRGIEPCIADLNRILKPVYTVVDGGPAMEGDGGVYGNPVPLNLLVGGTEVTAVDQICCRLMGVDYRSVAHIAALARDADPAVVGPTARTRFKLPIHSSMYHLLYRGLYAFDFVFHAFSEKRLNQWLYQTGHFGTRPRIAPDLCDRCEECTKVCPSQSIDLRTYRIDPHTCIRCLDCDDACPREAIKVLGFSNPQNATR
jgi:uncharacterized protein (DUF362 family)/ferredoxin